MPDPRRAVILLSGGLDSAATLYYAIQEGFSPVAISFRYGQRHQVELQAAQRIAQHAGVQDHRIVEIDLRQFGGSALTDDIEVPKHRSMDAISHAIPITYVPARNTIFLSYALALAEVVGSADLFIGVNALDYSGYPDCRPEYIQAFQQMARLATKSGVEGTELNIHTPLIHLSKAEIIRLGQRCGAPFELTMSCYDPPAENIHCGECDSCLLRKKGFAEAGIPDPTRYGAQA